MKIYIFRHGTTEWNFTFKIQGDTDIPLDTLGIKQAHTAALGMKNKGITFNKIYSSPLIRAVRTATEIRDILNPTKSLEIIKDERIRELCFGDFEGHTFDELVSQKDNPFIYFKTNPALYNKFAPDYYTSKQPESLTHLCDRASDFLIKEILPLEKSIPDGNILIVAHGAINKALLMHLTGENNLENFWGPGLQQNCQAAIVNITNGKSEVIEYAKDFS